ncbi:MAG: hypothetical protein ACRDSJ_00140 [Rubrobacteraceae bacterium]
MRVVEWGFRNKGLEGYYARDFEPSVLAVQEDLRPEAGAGAGGARLRREAAIFQVEGEILLCCGRPSGGGS